MPHMSRQIRRNEATAGFRTVTFRAWNTADGLPKTDLSAATAKIRTNGGSGTNSTNNFAHTSDGYYDLVLTQAETDIPEGYHLQIGPVSASGYAIVPGEAVIVPSGEFDAPFSLSDIIAAEIDALDGLSNGSGTVVINGVSFTVTRTAQDGIGTMTKD